MRTNKKILLIGGAGYIGTVMTNHLLENGFEVRCIDSLIYRNDICISFFLHNPKYDFFYDDLTNFENLKKILDGVTDVVILAGLVGDPITKKYPEASKRINLEGILNVLRSLNGQGLDRVIFISTCSNYGLIEDNAEANEFYELKPLSLYAEAKVAIEKEILSLKGKIDYSPVILRFATAFGLSPRMRFDLSVNEFTRELFLGKELLIYDADTWRPYCHVKDFSRAIKLVLDAPLREIEFQVYNAGGRKNNSTKQSIVNEIQRLIPNGKVKYKAHGTDPRNYKVDFSKIQEQLGFEPEYSISDGILELISALKKNIFSRVDEQRNFYGNYEIDCLEYPSIQKK
jgi:nucleoside-diphosphate-sugar epimerase